MTDKFTFYEEHGVEEYYVYDPDLNRLMAFVRRDDILRRVRPVDSFVSPRLGIRFQMTEPEMTIYGPDGKQFLTFEELKDAQESRSNAPTRQSNWLPKCNNAPTGRRTSCAACLASKRHRKRFKNCSNSCNNPWRESCVETQARTSGGIAMSWGRLPSLPNCGQTWKSAPRPPLATNAISSILAPTGTDRLEYAKAFRQREMPRLPPGAGLFRERSVGFSILMSHG